MKSIWNVKIHFVLKEGGEECDTWDEYYIEAADDLAARGKAIKIIKTRYDGFVRVIYAEIEHKLDFED